MNHATSDVGRTHRRHGVGHRDEVRHGEGRSHPRRGVGHRADRRDNRALRHMQTKLQLSML